jgi:hypothetical protein
MITRFLLYVCEVERCKANTYIAEWRTSVADTNKFGVTIYA